MKNIALLHNPNAGDEAHSKEKLIHQLEEEGYNCRYSSTKEKGWDKLKDDTDLVVMAGGDGTIRKVLLKFFAEEKNTTIPFTLLPLGTANNIARTFGIEGTTIEIIRSWKKGHVKKIDVGEISGAGVSGFFLESFGAGLFPQLMKEMKRQSDPSRPPEEELLKALELFHAAVLSASTADFQISINDTDHSGKYLLLEIMNMRSIGPNLALARNADPGDGKMEVILVGENERALFAEHIKRKMSDPADAFPFEPIQADAIEVRWDGKNAHADDTFIKPEEGKKIRIGLAEKKVNLLLGNGTIE